jgi:hypothetical protein
LKVKWTPCLNEYLYLIFDLTPIIKSISISLVFNLISKDTS